MPKSSRQKRRTYQTPTRSRSGSNMVWYAAAGVMAFGAWRRLSRISDGTRWSRAHAMAIAGIASSAIYLLLVVFGFVAPLFLRTCSTSL